MLRVFISQPMARESEEKIKKERQRIIDSIVSEFGEEIEIIDSYFEGAPADVRPLWFIGKAIELLSTADMAYFAPGWKDARGCRIEHKAAEEYGIEIICDGRGEGCNAGEGI